MRKFDVYGDAGGKYRWRLIAGNGENYAPGDVAARVVEFIAALYRSAESGRPEIIPSQA